jgi:hypothetical protein
MPYAAVWAMSYEPCFFTNLDPNSKVFAQYINCPFSKQNARSK